MRVPAVTLNGAIRKGILILQRIEIIAIVLNKVSSNKILEIGNKILTPSLHFHDSIGNYVDELRILGVHLYYVRYGFHTTMPVRDCDRREVECVAPFGNNGDPCDIGVGQCVHARP